jgi:hypothetical protein
MQIVEKVANWKVKREILILEKEKLEEDIAVSRINEKQKAEFLKKLEEIEIQKRIKKIIKDLEKNNLAMTNMETGSTTQFTFVAVNHTPPFPFDLSDSEKK